MLCKVKEDPKRTKQGGNDGNNDADDLHNLERYTGERRTIDVHRAGLLRKRTGAARIFNVNRKLVRTRINLRLNGYGVGSVISHCYHACGSEQVSNTTCSRFVR